MYSVLRKEWGKALADSGGGKPPCDYCGGGGDNGEPDEPSPEDTCELAFLEEDEEMPEDEFCPACGCQTEFAIYFEDQLE